MNPRLRLAAGVAMTATIAGLLSASAAPAGAVTGATARLRDGVLTVTGTAARDVAGISMSHRQVAVDFGFDGTADARFPMSGVRQLTVQLGDGNDGLSVIGVGVGDVPITISGGLGNDAGGVVGTEDPLLARNAPVTIGGGGGDDNLSAFVPGSAPVSVGQRRRGQLWPAAWPGPAPGVLAGRPGGGSRRPPGHRRRPFLRFRRALRDGSRRRLGRGLGSGRCCGDDAAGEMGGVVADEAEQ